MLFKQLSTNIKKKPPTINPMFIDDLCALFGELDSCINSDRFDNYFKSSLENSVMQIIQPIKDKYFDLFRTKANTLAQEFNVNNTLQQFNIEMKQLTDRTLTEFISEAQNSVQQTKEESQALRNTYQQLTVYLKTTEYLNMFLIRKNAKEQSEEMKKQWMELQKQNEVLQKKQDDAMKRLVDANKDLIRKIKEEKIEEEKRRNNEMALLFQLREEKEKYQHALYQIQLRDIELKQAQEKEERIAEIKQLEDKQKKVIAQELKKAAKDEKKKKEMAQKCCNFCNISTPNKSQRFACALPNCYYFTCANCRKKHKCTTCRKVHCRKHFRVCKYCRKITCCPTGGCYRKGCKTE